MAEPARRAAFGRALPGNAAAGIAKPNSLYNSRPLTVECWAKLNSKAGFNILVANERKSSATHWELYTFAGSGKFSLYQPGCAPNTVQSVDVCDGKWHYLAAVMEATRARLFVDAKLVADVKLKPPSAPGHAGPLVIGDIVAGTIGCDGIVDEVRISNVARELESAPAGPFQVDKHTLGLWRLDEDEQAKFFVDSSPTANHAERRVIRRLDRADPTELTSEEAGERRKGNGPPGGTPLPLPPPEVDLKATRRAFERALAELNLPSLRNAERTRDGVLFDWEEQYFRLDLRVTGKEVPPKGAAEQAFDKHALCYATDGDPLGVVLRRTEALITSLHDSSYPSDQSDRSDLPNLTADFTKLKAHCTSVPLTDTPARKRLYLVACALRRQLAFANPLLDFDKILFVARGVRLGSRVTGPRSTHDVWGQHFATQYYGFNALPGGGLFAVEGFKDEPRAVNLLANSVVQNGRLKGRKLDPGAFLSPDLSWDGVTIAFAYTENREHRWVWSKQTTFNLFKVNVEGTNLVQLTDSEFDDFDPCWLPNGRLAFISERRGGYIRCFGTLHVPNHVLHSMNADGTGVIPLSYYETSEWHPSVNNEGMIVYTRWDYTDRENCLGSNFWICYPDGRDARAPHGNYPYPWHTFLDNTYGDTRRGRPFTEMSIRAVPGSDKYVATAAPHHGEAFGSLIMLDLRPEDDGFMSQLKRLTPYPPFPESEMPGRSQYPFGTPWPLSEDYYLCNWWENLYLLDRFGNRELICENSLVFGETNWDFRLIDPIPLKARPRPPVVPTKTAQGARIAVPGPPDAAVPGSPDVAVPGSPDPALEGPLVSDQHHNLERVAYRGDLSVAGRGLVGKPAHHSGAGDTPTLSILNVYDSDLPFPKGTKIKWLRVVQNILKTNPIMGRPMIGYQNENTPRIPLGIVPVEDDGSAHFEAPAGKELIFQVLDENYMAVQSMRSVAYLHRGEHLTCQGCHERKHTTPALKRPPKAMQRPPSKLKPEVGPVEPITYYRLVKPVFDRTCLPCHKQRRKGPTDMSYQALEPYAFYFAGGMSGTTVKPIHGGSRSIPGRFGARNSRMGRALLNDTHRGKIPQEDFRRVVLWLDCNSLRLGAYCDEEKQMKGEVVWPVLDVEPTGPAGPATPVRRLTARAQRR